MGMEKTQRLASEKRAYTLTDRAPGWPPKIRISWRWPWCWRAIRSSQSIWGDGGESAKQSAGQK